MMGDLTERAQIKELNEFYKKRDADKAERIQNLQDENNELHKDVFNMGLAEEQHQEVLVVIKDLLSALPSYSVDKTLEELGNYHRAMLIKAGVL
ncbi:MAG: hypothetical protein PUG13_06800 [Streptococcus hyointestinalis]|nr:hypothetical protein [Streptococcus hyointestinalis]MDD6385103.1 hypothetical protein [Streptococcus hyointestinalis]